MDFTPYLHEIESELMQLKAIRRMFSELREPVVLMENVAAPKKTVVVVEPVLEVMTVRPEVAADPILKVVPPKQRREYHPRARGAVEQKAIGGTIPDRPVFVRPVTVTAPADTQAPAETDVVALEAAIRRKLLGRVA